VIAFLIFYEAGRRLINPAPVGAPVMMAVAAIGVVMNGAIAFLLHRSGSDVNIRSALVHMLGDTLSTAAVIVGGWAIMVTGQTWIDPALSFGIGALILWSSFGIIRETLNILLEGTPRGVNMELVTAELMKVEGVRDVHDLHIWSLGSESHALSCHIAIQDIPPSVSERILREVQGRLRAEFSIQHTTIQFEHVVCDIEHGCVVVPDRRRQPREAVKRAN
jgi:cobalt-zinc-cadmium efflux system protein